MSTISKVTSANPIIHPLDAPVIMSPKDFLHSFGIGKALQITTDESKMSGETSISSIECGDCITVFTIEKEDGITDAIMGWHLSDGSTVEEIIDEFDEYTDANLDHDFYIIGGNKGTTQGQGCLLENIHAAIKERFTGKSKILKELVHLNAANGLTFVSANLQMNGTLSYCLHN